MLEWFDLRFAYYFKGLELNYEGPQRVAMDAALAQFTNYVVLCWFACVPPSRPSGNIPSYLTL